MKKNNKQDISIIIPAYNEEKNLPATIESINKALESIKAKYEIIVVDNNSTDKTSKLAENLGAKVVFQKERSIAKTRNAGAKVAIGKYLLFVDADTEIPANLVNKAYEEIIKEKVTLVSTIMTFKKYPSISSYGIWFYNLISKIIKRGIGPFIFVQKDAFQKVGGFNEEYYAFEEVEFFNKIKKNFGRSGFKVLFIPVKTSGRKFEKGKRDTNKFLLLLVAQFLGKDIGKDKKQLDFWYQESNVQQKNNRYKIALLFLIWFLFTSDNRFIIIDDPIRQWAYITTPIIFLLMVPVILDRKKDIKIFIEVVAITMIIEIIGSKTGIPFGKYDYSDIYGQIGILGVPIFIGIAWYIILTGISFITKNRWLTAIVIIFFDVLLEVFAVKSGLWTWDDSNFSLFGVPIINYITWGVIAFLLYPLVIKQKVNRIFATALITVLLGYISATMLIMGYQIGIIGYIYVLVLMAIGLRYSIKNL